MRSRWSKGAALAALAVLVAVAGVFAAQELTRRVIIKVNVPFAFSVEGKDLPAGTYLFRSNSDDKSISITDESEKEFHRFVPTQFIDRPKDQIVPGGEIVFNQYGDRYFLSEIWEGGSEAGYFIPPTKAEKELAGTQKPAKVRLPKREK